MKFFFMFLRLIIPQLLEKERTDYAYFKKEKGEADVVMI